MTGIINKSERRVDEPEDQIRVDPQVALIKDLATNDVLDSNIIFVLFPLTLSQPRIKAQFQVLQ